MTRKTLDDDDHKRLVEEALKEVDFTRPGRKRQGGRGLAVEEIARVYAEALFEVAKEKDKLDRVREELGQFADALDDDRELQVFFFSPYFSLGREARGDRARRSAAPSEEFVNFLELLIEKHRMPVIFRIRRQFERLWKHENRKLDVTVTSAVELDSGVVEQVGAEIEKQTGQLGRAVEQRRRGDPRRPRASGRQHGA